MKNITLILLIIVITLSEALGQFLLSISHYNTLRNISYYGPIPTKMLPIITWILYGNLSLILLIVILESS